MSDKPLKTGWRMVRFGNVVRQIKDRMTDLENCGLTEYTRGEHFESGNLHLIGRSQLGDGQHGSAFHMRFRPGDVLYVSRNPHLRKVAVADYEGICANTSYVFRADGKYLIQELLPFVMQTEEFVEYTIQHKRGSTNFYLNPSDIEPYDFFLPPLDEQRRIADLLWVADEEIDSFKRLFDNLCKLELSVKLSIFSANNYKVKLGNLIEKGILFFKTGPFGTVLQASSYVKQGIPVVNPVNMLDGKFYVKDGPFINEKEAKRLEIYKIVENDLIFRRKGEIGKGIFATKENEGYIFGSDCICVRVLGTNIQPKYLFYYLTSPNSQRLLGAQSHGTIMPGINEKMLSRMEITIPNIEDQLEVIARLQQIEDTKHQLQDKISKSHHLKRTLLQSSLGYD